MNNSGNGDAMVWLLAALFGCERLAGQGEGLGSTATGETSALCTVLRISLQTAKEEAGARASW